MKSYDSFSEDTCVANERSKYHHSEKQSFLKTPPKYVHRKVFVYVREYPKEYSTYVQVSPAEEGNAKIKLVTKKKVRNLFSHFHTIAPTTGCTFASF